MHLFSWLMMTRHSHLQIHSNHHWLKWEFIITFMNRKKPGEKERQWAHMPGAGFISTWDHNHTKTKKNIIQNAQMCAIWWYWNGMQTFDVYKFRCLCSRLSNRYSKVEHRRIFFLRLFDFIRLLLISVIIVIIYYHYYQPRSFGYRIIENMCVGLGLGTHRSHTSIWNSILWTRTGIFHYHCLLWQTYVRVWIWYHYM